MKILDYKKYIYFSLEFCIRTKLRVQKFSIVESVIIPQYNVGKYCRNSHFRLYEHSKSILNPQNIQSSAYYVFSNILSYSL